MSTNDMDIENQSTIAAPSTQPEIQESVPMAVPEDPQSQEKQYNERRDTGGKYPYIDKIIELSNTQRRYEAQARKWQHELNLTSKSEFEVVKTYTSTYDQLFSYSWRRRVCGNLCSYNFFCNACVDSPICAIFDFTFDENMSAQRFTNTEIEDKFCEALEAPSSNVKTRIILVTLWNASQTSEVEWDDIPRKTDFWPNMPGAKLTNLLGTKYDLDPLFYDQIMSDREREFWERGQKYGERRKSSTRYGFMTQTEPTFLSLGFKDTHISEVAPRLWGVMKIGYPGPDQNTVILFHLPQMNSPESSSNVISDIDREYYQSVGASHSKERVAFMIERIQKLGANDMETFNKFPLNLSIPVLETLELYFMQRITTMEVVNSHSYAESSSEETDIVLRRAWEAGRSAIEDFQIILDQIDDYSERLTSETANEERKELNFFMKRCRRTLSRARLSEQYLRDKIQINVGTLSLEESRKSIQQANSIGRISFLGFVFLPLSLVMSFYGMNINEITGSGASWRAFVISTSVLCFVIFVVCSLIFRESEKVRFISLAPVVPFFWAVSLATRLRPTKPEDDWSLRYYIRERTRRFINDWWKTRLAFIKGATEIKEKL